MQHTDMMCHRILPVHSKLESTQWGLGKICAKFTPEHKGNFFLIVIGLAKIRGHLHNSKFWTYRYILGKGFIIYYLLFYRDIFLNGDCLLSFSCSGQHMITLRLNVKISLFSLLSWDCFLQETIS